MIELTEQEMAEFRDAFAKLVRSAREMVEVWNSMPEKIRNAALLIADVESAFKGEESGRT